MIKTDRLSHGGIMANYRCTAACRHCLYACSPERTGGYITREITEEVCELLKAGGCRSVHIGGGEPFLDFDGLLMLIKTVTRSGIRVEYIETNAFWAADRKQITASLMELMKAGADTLCISIDPFHAEYVPVELPLTLAAACNKAGFGYFLWQERFYPMLSKLDHAKTHSRAQMEKLISSRYVIETARNYGLQYGGRALNIEEEYVSRMPVETIIDSKQCHCLLSGGHFHVDMFGRYIPPGCTGFVVPLSEAVNGIPEGKYPVYETLLSGGTAALLKYAQGRGFTADTQGYTSRCALCFHIQHWLCENAPSPELDPEHYIEAMKYW